MLAATDAAAPGVDARSVDAGAPNDAFAVDTGVPNDAWAQPGVDAFVEDAFVPPVDAGVSYCPPGARVCDDFEMGPVSRQPPFDWGPDVVQSTARAHRGAASGLFETMAAGEQPSVGVDFTTPPTDIWARFWAYVDSANVVQESSLFAVNEGVPPYGGTSLLLNDSGLAVYTSGGTGTYLSGVPMPRDRWVCLSMHVVVGPMGTIDVSLDGASVVSGVADTRLPAGVNNASVGITYTGSAQTPPLSYAIDDVAITIDGTPLPCF